MLRNWGRTAGVIFVALCAAACADTELDRIYIDSLHHRMEMERQHGREFQMWGTEHERWKRGELGPDAPEPVYPPSLHDDEARVVRMRFMEREFVAFLERICANGSLKCIFRELEKLEFKCDDANPISCTLNNTAHADYYDYFFTRHIELHAWTVTVSRDGARPSVRAHVEELPKKPIPPYRPEKNRSLPSPGREANARPHKFV